MSDPEDEDRKSPTKPKSAGDEADFDLSVEFHEEDGGLELRGSRPNDLNEDEDDDEIGEEAADLEFDFEPGISLGNLEFSQRIETETRRRLSLNDLQSLERSSSASVAAMTSSVASCWPESCLFCGIDYETGKLTFRIQLFWTSIMILTCLENT